MIGPQSTQAMLGAACSADLSRSTLADLGANK
jgi:hypothetical protein